MKYLIVYAHPNPKSFNQAIKEQVEAQIKKTGKEFAVRDLYRMKFNPLLDVQDFSLMIKGRLAKDIKREQDYVKDAHTLIFIYPIWWFGMPAILKGYIDRVFSHGFAFRFTEKGPEGLLPGKKVIIFNTTGGPESNYSSMGYADALRKTTDIGIFEFCGMNIILHKYFYAAPYVSNKVRLKMLEELKEIKL